MDAAAGDRDVPATATPGPGTGRGTAGSLAAKSLAARLQALAGMELAVLHKRLSQTIRLVEMRKKAVQAEISARQGRRAG